MEKTALELLEDVSETLTDFVIDETVPQEIRDRIAPTAGSIDEFLADSLIDGEAEDGYYNEDEDEYDEEELEDDDTYEDDEDLDLELPEAA